MNADTQSLLVRGLTLACALSIPVLVAALLSGVFTSVLQAVTTWSDAALSHVPRLLAVGVAVLLSAPWIAHELTAFARLAWGGTP